MSKKVYIAAPFYTRAGVRRKLEEIQVMGFDISNCRWPFIEEETNDPNLRHQNALMDMDDVMACNVFIMLNYYSVSPGRMIETGMALAKADNDIIVVGNTVRSIFLDFKFIVRVHDWQNCLHYLSTGYSNGPK